MTKREDEVAARFLRDIEGARLTVRHDDGIYRHLAFDTPHGSYWFELVTWPNALTIRGDMGSWTFSRLPDMFRFFRGSAYEGRPNFYYWGEKTEDGRRSTEEYSDEAAREQIIGAAKDYVADDPALSGLLGAVVEDILSQELHDETTTRNLIDDFSYCYDDDGVPQVFRFDSWEWDFHRQTTRFMWNCHAILWGIEQYDKARATNL